jgi:Ice-binding-like/Secretion system C-terminal sorting domain
MKFTLLNTFSVVLLLLFSSKIYAQTSQLGSTANFALFTKVGEFTNNGISDVTGDIGTNAGAVTGFPPGLIAGQIQIENPITLQAGNDVIAAYNYFAGLPCTNPLSTNLGGGQILAPNTYCVGAATSLTGDLILDAENDPNALFIFQINGAFSMAALANIVLINGATFDQVFWQINGAVDLSENTVFRGTIVANGAISLLGGASLFGRGLSQVGAIEITTSFVFLPQIPLPIKLVKFSAKNNEENNIIEWQSSAEGDGDFYELEKSFDIKEFSVIAQINTNGKNNLYQFVDINSTIGTSYYRLKMSELGGKFNYSNIVAAFKKPIEEFVFEAYPNPVQDILKVKFNPINLSNQSLNVFDSMGKMVLTGQTQSEIDMRGLPQGFYYIRYNSENQTKFLKVIKR